MTTPTSIYGKKCISETVSVNKLNAGLKEEEYPLSMLIFDLLINEHQKIFCFKVIYKNIFSTNREKFYFGNSVNKKFQRYLYILCKKQPGHSYLTWNQYFDYQVHTCRLRNVTINILAVWCHVVKQSVIKSWI